MRHLLKLCIPAIASSLLIAACGGTSASTTNSGAAAEPAAQTSSASSSDVVKTVSNSTLGTVLVDSNGMTLYHLSGEQNGKFICTSSGCVGIWHPLTASSASAPTGVGSVGTVKRPDGTLQVAYKGTPLYTFAHDQQPGQTNGQGIKDVGTWSAVRTGASPTSATSTSSTPAPPAKSSGGGGGYAY